MALFLLAPMIKLPSNGRQVHICCYHRNSRTRTLAASRDIADLWRSKMVPTKRQNNGGIADQLTRANYWLDRARYLSIKFGSTTGQMD